MSLATWTDDEMRAFASAVRGAGVDPTFALAVYASESGLDPHAVNPHSLAQGLAQMMPQFLPGWGFHGNPVDFHSLSVTAQLPYIVTMLRGQLGALGRSPETAAKLYHLNLYPATARNPVAIERSKDPRSYDANVALDVNRDGVIDETDLDAFLDRVRKTADFARVLDQLARVDTYDTAVTSRPAPAPKSKKA